MRGNTLQEEAPNFLVVFRQNCLSVIATSDGFVKTDHVNEISNEDFLAAKHWIHRSVK